MSTSLSIESSDAISSLRSDLRQQIKDDREKRRHRSVDSIRLGIGEVTEQLGNLRNYSTKDVTELAGRIKQQKHASTDDLNCLAHAFIQSVENITCFLNITGALNVLVKELTGQIRHFSTVIQQNNLKLIVIRICLQEITRIDRY